MTVRLDAVKSAPNSPTAPVVFRGNVDIYDEKQLAQLANVTHIIGNVNIMIGGKNLVLPNLVKVEGDLNLGSNKAIELPKLQTVTGGLVFAGGATRSIKLPSLEVAAGGVNVGSSSYPLPMLTTLDLPKLRETGNFSSAATGLKALSLPALERAQWVQITRQPKLTTLALPRLATVTYRVDIDANPKLTTPALSALAKALVKRGVDRANLFFDRGLPKPKKPPAPAPAPDSFQA